MAWTSISCASKKVDVLPSRAIFRTWPSFPVPAQSVPSGAGTSVQMKGAAGSAPCARAGPRGGRQQRPDERRRGLGDLRRRGAEEDPAVAVDREVFDVSLEEVRL